MFLDIFCNKKCIETGETPKYLEQAIFFRGYCCFSCLRHFFETEKQQKIIIFKEFSCFSTSCVSFDYKNVKKHEKQQNPLKSHYFKGFCRFTVSRHFWIQKVSRNRRNDKIPWIHDRWPLCNIAPNDLLDVQIHKSWQEFIKIRIFWMEIWGTQIALAFNILTHFVSDICC